MPPRETRQSLRLALDQNFPADLLSVLQDWLPPDVSLEHIASIDPRLSDLDDDQLIIALHQTGFDGLVTNNYKMLRVEHELAAIIATKAVVVASVELGHDPIRAAGAVLLELPGLPDRLIPDQANAFWLKYARRRPESGWHHLQRIADRQGTEAASIWPRLRPDIDTPVLSDG